MSIRPIKSDQDYDAALEEIESLFASKPGTDDADRLEVLVVLAQDYQRTHFPVGPPDMQSAIEHELDRRGLMSQGAMDVSGVEVGGGSGGGQGGAATPLPARARRTRQSV